MLPAECSFMVLHAVEASNMAVHAQQLAYANPGEHSAASQALTLQPIAQPYQVAGIHSPARCGGVQHGRTCKAARQRQPG